MLSDNEKKEIYKQKLIDLMKDQEMILEKSKIDYLHLDLKVI
jgi:hypothetical protein